MFSALSQLVALARGRSAQWPALRRRWIAAHPECAACGAARGLEAHHVLPVHFAPSLELDEGNLLTLCRACHWTFGHLALSWSVWNAEAREDAETWLKKRRAWRVAA